MRSNRVVLNLTTEQAEMLNGFIKRSNNGQGSIQEAELMSKIFHRVEKTLIKQKVIKNLKNSGIEPTKLTIQATMEVAMPELVPAIQQAIDEVYLTDEDRVMQQSTELRPEAKVIE